MTPEEKTWIDNASLYDLLYRWRFAPAGTFVGDVGIYHAKVMFAKRDADPEEWTRVSKDVGWGPNL